MGVRRESGDGARRARPRWGFFLTAALMVGAVAVVAFRSPERDDFIASPIPFEGDAEPVARAASGAPATGVRVAPPPSTVTTAPPPRPWPANGTPVAELLRVLRPAAVAGNARAACRLGIELAACRLATLAARAERGGSRGPATADEGPCTGIDDAQAAESLVFLEQAANAGSVAAMVQYVIAPPLEEPRREAESDAWDRYRRQAPRWLDQALAAGDPRALHFAAWAAAGGSTPGETPLVARDPQVALVHSHAARRFATADDAVMLDRQIQRLTQEVGVARAAAAHAEGEALYARRFSGARPSQFSQGLTRSLSAGCE